MSETPGTDGFVQVAPDSTGKTVDMKLIRTVAGDSIYRQRAELSGSAADAILALDDTARKQLAVLRGILFALTNGEVTEEMFLDE